MANCVYSYIDFYNTNESREDALLNYFSDMLKSIVSHTTEPGTECIFGTSIHELMSRFGYDVPSEAGMDEGWFLDNIGAKWCYLDDISEGFIETRSAWVPPLKLVAAFCEILSLNFPDTYAVTFYIDEKWDFLGCALIDETGIKEREELNYDKVLNQFEEDTGNRVPTAPNWDDDELITEFENWVLDWKNRSARNMRELLQG
jgi:hypothetical protein